MKVLKIKVCDLMNPHWICSTYIFILLHLAKRRLFENKRKAHYNEFMAVKLARQLMEKEADNEEESEEATEKTTDADEVDLEEVDNTSDTINNVPIDDKSSHVNSDSLDDMDTKDSDSVGVVQDSSVDIV